MKTSLTLIKRNLKLFFKDKGMFFPSLITPLILLVLYATFLANVYRDSFTSALPEGLNISEKLLNGTVVCQLTSSLLAVSCVTVSFCANLLMINDKANGAIKDFYVSPVKRSYLAISYYAASSLSTLIVTLSALCACFIYLAIQGWFLSFVDVILIIADVVLLTLFGTALSSCINFFLNTSGQASAVGTIISSCYGFVCGAYMPIASFSKGLQNVLKFLPGTYGTSLIRNRMMRGVFAEMENYGFPKEVMSGIKESIDCIIYIGDNEVSIGTMATILVGSIVLLTGVFVLLNILKSRKAK